MRYRLWPALVGFCCLVIQGDARADTVLPRFLLEGIDISEKVDAEVVLRRRDTSPEDTVKTEIVCRPLIPCAIPPGPYVIGVRSEQVVPERRRIAEFTGAADEFLGPLWIPVVRAASIELPAGLMQPGSSLQAVDVATGTPFQRTISEAAVHLVAPARPIVLVFTGPDRRDLALLRLSPKPGEAVQIKAFPRISKGRGQMFATFAAGQGGDLSREAVDVTAHFVEGALPADLVIRMGTGPSYAFWFDTPPGNSTIRIESTDFILLKSRPVTIPEQGVGTLRGEILPRRPRLKVALVPPEDLKAAEAEVDLFDCDAAPREPQPPALSLCSQVGSQRGKVSETFQFFRLKPVPYAVRWRLGPASAVETFLLKEAEEASRAVEIREIKARGTVRSKGVGIEAVLRWQRANTEVETSATAGPDGRYEVMLYQPGMYGVSIDTGSGPPRNEYVSLADDLNRDFDVPGNRVVARIKNAATGEPIPESWLSCEATEKGADPTASFLADLQGVVRLPPLKNGRYSVIAGADKYKPPPPQSLAVTDETADVSLEFNLERDREFPIRVLSADGEPAVGAQLCNPLDSWGGCTIPTTKTGTDGILTLPRTPLKGIPFSIVGPRYEVAFFRVSGDEEETVRLPPPAPMVEIRFKRPDGTPIADQVAVCTIDGMSCPVDMLLLAALGGRRGSDSSGVALYPGFSAGSELTLWPNGHPELTQTRRVPVTEPIVFVFAPTPGR